MHDNAEIARTFDTLADLLEIEDANPFRVRAYRNAARTVEGLSQSVAAMLAEGRDLTELPGIGKDLAEKIRVAAETGTLALLEEVKQRVPEALSLLTRVEGLGPKRVKVLYDALAVRSVGDLQEAVERGRVRELRGFGERTESLIRKGIARLQARQGRIRLVDAESVAERLRAHLAETAGVKRVCIAGSYRRRCETVGDLDLLASCRRGAAVMDRFTGFAEVDEVLSRGQTRSSVRLRGGLQVDLRVVPEVAFGAALHYFTGSKAHNIALRRLAQGRGLKVNEYGVFRGAERIAGRSEKAVFAAVGLPYIEPELREDRGEIEAARQGRLPRLVREADLRGELHAHTTATDGRDSLEAMVAAAQARGYEYLAITDHSRAVTVARGLDVRRLREQLAAIDRLQEHSPGIRILKGCEVDILEDGSLDLPGEVLRELDLTVCSVHSHFGLSEQKQTARILHAMDQPHFRILGHPTGRLLNRREPYALDLERIVEGARERGRFLELNAQPSRLDLTDHACRLARERGVKVAISTDAHSVEGLANRRFGIGQARRGWLAPGDVLNTLPLTELLRVLGGG